MRIVADLHISPRTVEFLRLLGHDVVRVGEVLNASTPDETIVHWAAEQNRTILTQDLDFTDIIALSGQTHPSLVVLRLSSSRIEHVNSVLERALPGLEADVIAGAIISVRDERIRRRRLPVT